MTPDPGYQDHYAENSDVIPAEPDVGDDAFDADPTPLEEDEDLTDDDFDPDLEEFDPDADEDESGEYDDLSVDDLED